MNKVIIVGGGAAGMMAAYFAGLSGNDVTLYEKNEKLGKKVFITGKGRCNVTNAGDTNEFFNAVNSNPKFLYSSIYGFDAFMVMELIESLGCSLKVERGDRVFPVSDHSSDVIKALERGLAQNGVRVVKNTFVSDLIVDEGVCCGVILENKEKAFADKVILCTGGASYASTGSDGYFFERLKKHGHTITGLKPGLVPLVCADKICKELMGLSLKNVSLNLYVNNRNIYSGFGEMLFTHFGISGPLVLSASSIYSNKYFNQKCRAVIDFKPALTNEKLDARILRDFDENKNKALKNVIEGLLPKRLAAFIPSYIGVPEGKKINEITGEERLRLVHILKNFELEVTGTRDLNEAIITVGGVNVKEINPSTMESRLIKNLYFAGEMIDVDAVTGGYNLQIAWSTGKMAGENN